MTTRVDDAGRPMEQYGDAEEPNNRIAVPQAERGCDDLAASNRAGQVRLQ